MLKIYENSFPSEKALQRKQCSEKGVAPLIFLVLLYERLKK